MCGICGVFEYKSDKSVVDTDLLMKMRGTMVHRGPDDEGMYISRDKQVGLGHRRLSIIDLTQNAKQPISNESKTVWLICNGEIYNYKELRVKLENRGHIFKSQTDIEVIVHLYEERGISLLEEIDGDFAFGLWDESRKKLFVARDRLGIKPCLYFEDSDRFLFASEIKAILQDYKVPREIDLIALHHYLTFMSIPAPYTIYKGIRKLLPGHYLVADDNGTKLIEYWDLDSSQYKSVEYKKENEYIDEFVLLFKNAIKKRLMSDVPLGVFLSGGVDSSSIVALLAKIEKSTKTFSVVFGDEYSCDESAYSREIANLFETEHYEYRVDSKIFHKLPDVINHFDEPFAIPSAVPLYFLSQHANSIIKVALTGDGGDELFAGYRRYKWDRIVQHLHSVKLGPPAKAIFSLLTKISSAKLPYTISKAKDLIGKLLLSISMDSDNRYLSYFSFLSEDMKDYLYNKNVQDQLSDFYSVTVLQHYYKKILESSSLTKRLYGDIKTTLPDEMLTKADRMAMAHSIENRVPLLDQELVEFACRLPSRFKLRGREGKYIIKKAMNDKLPHQLLFRRKAGFNVPLGHWLRNDLKWLITEYLDHEKIKQGNIFQAHAISKLVNLFINDRKNLEYHLYPLLVFQIWYSECFIRGSNAY